MNVLIPLQLLVFFVVPLLLPLAAVAPAEAKSEPLAAERLHAALVAPRGVLAALPGLPPAGERREPVRKDPRNLGVTVSAKSALVVDRKSGAVLFTKGADAEHAIASLTKLMTALVVLDAAPDLSREITIQAGDRRGGGVEYFIPGETVTVKDLLYVSLVGSSNTATAALARSTGLSTEEFTRRMNAKAAALGLESSRFNDPTGLDDANRGTARDIAIMAGAAFANPEIAKVATTGEYSFKPKNSRTAGARTIKSTDLLLKSLLNQGDYRITGAKTGTLGAETGYHLAVAVAAGDGREVLVVVLGSDSDAARFEDAKALAYWAFDSYDWK
jgi:D-alanyl-D-alanine carboxypeptidase